MRAKRLLMLITLSCAMMSMRAQSFVVGDFRYNVIGDKVVEVEGLANKKLPMADIPSSVPYNGNTYIVERIGKYAFWFKSKLQSINLPATIKTIGSHAFYGSGISTLKLPIGVERIEDNAFGLCKSLKYVYFPPSLIYIGSGCFYECENLIRQEGFHSGIEIGEVAFKSAPIKYNININDGTFSYNYVNKIYMAMQEWQKKKTFETVDQWRTRVTTQSRERKFQQFVSQFKQKYIQTRSAYAKPHFTLSLYDDDYNVFSLQTEGYGTVYVFVPQSEQYDFEKGFDASKIVPTYCVKDDSLAIASVTVSINGKIYSSPNPVGETSSEGQMAMELPPLDFNLNENAASLSDVKTMTFDKALDENIPVTDTKANNTFVIAIGNENYQIVPRVPFAENDMNIFAQYCNKTLGVPISNVRKYKDATFGVMLSALNDLKDIAEAYNGDINVIFYYAGHGVPSETEHTAYLLPTDADAKQTEVCFPVSRLYNELAGLKAKSVIVFMDACFSGSQRGDGMLASARGVAIKAKQECPQGNMVVFSAATGEETAYPYKDKGHGMFTYFLLKKLQESRGNCTLGELSQYITANVKRQSVVVNRKSQTPTVVPSDNIVNGWENMKLR